MIFFKFPFAEDILTITENSDSAAVSFVSFDEKEMLEFKGEITTISAEEFSQTVALSSNLRNELKDFKAEEKEDYTEKLQEVIDFIKQNSLSKLVISRRKLLHFEGREINFVQTFLNLKKTYPNAFAYFFAKDGECWIGAFSELLGKFNKQTSEFETMALAGTLHVAEDWTSKEIDEQQPVTEFISDILKRFGNDVFKSETYDHISGNIKHLRTDFKLKIAAESLDELISELHPTPAVCGIPKEICIPVIEKFEDSPRKFYAGYIKVETSETIQYFVNLRCAEIFSDAALIYVGGGITADSIPEKEWRETELKSQAIANNLHFKTEK